MATVQECDDYVYIYMGKVVEQGSVLGGPVEKDPQSLQRDATNLFKASLPFGQFLRRERRDESPGNTSTRIDAKDKIDAAAKVPVEEGSFPQRLSQTWCPKDRWYCTPVDKATPHPNFVAKIKTMQDDRTIHGGANEMSAAISACHTSTAPDEVCESITLATGLIWPDAPCPDWCVPLAAWLRL